MAAADVEYGVSTWANPHHDVRAVVNYFPTEKKDYQVDEVKPPAKNGDVVPSSRYMTFYNARGKEDQFQLDRNGFQFHTLEDKERDVSTDEVIKAEFYPEVKEIIQKITGADHVFVKGHNLRQVTNEFFIERPDTKRYYRFAGVWPHSDFPVAKREEVDKLVEDTGYFSSYLKDEAERDEVKKIGARCSRWAVVQIWKPLRTLQRDPLAVCDTLTYEQDDWRYREPASGRTPFSVLARPDEERHKWYYLHDMAPNEMFVFKGCDSKQGEPGFTGYAGAHIAFVLPDSEDKPMRENIEAHCLCFWD